MDSLTTLSWDKADWITGIPCTNLRVDWSDSEHVHQAALTGINVDCGSSAGDICVPATTCGGCFHSVTCNAFLYLIWLVPPENSCSRAYPLTHICCDCHQVGYCVEHCREKKGGRMYILTWNLLMMIHLKDICNHHSCLDLRLVTEN